MTKTKEQLAFETWMEAEGPKFNTDRYEGEASSEYYGIITELMWRAWETRSELKEQTVDVPNGYKLVPLVPTLAMCEASGFDVSESREAYKKMILAVPGNNQVSLQSNEHTPKKNLFDPDAYLHVCRKKPELKKLSFCPDEPCLKNKGYSVKELYTVDRVKQIVNKTKEDTLNACITFVIHGDADFFGLPEGLVDYFKRVVEPTVQNVQSVENFNVATLEPVARIRYERNKEGCENEMPKVISCNWLLDGTYDVYTRGQLEAAVYLNNQPE